MINGFCEEFDTNKIHAKRLTSVLERLFANEDEIFLKFFRDEKLSIPYQFLQYLNAQGEILHVVENRYALPPERTIVLPDGQNVVISSLEKNSEQVGSGRFTTEKTAIFLNYDEYVFLPTFEQIIQHYENKLKNHHDIEPSEIVIFNELGSFKSTNFKQVKDGDYYILKVERLLGVQIKTENYFAKRQDREWFVAEIRNGLFVRTRMALRSRKNVNSTYWLSEQSNGLIQVNLQYSLPKEEESLMRLIATPKEYKWSKSYLTTKSQLENIRAIFTHCKLKEVKGNGIHN